MTTKCRSCGAAIFWRKTSSGKAMPLDPMASPKGNVQLGWVGGEEIAIVVNAADALAAQVEGIPLYLSHFATCPNHNEWRRPRCSSTQ